MCPFVHVPSGDLDHHHGVVDQFSHDEHQAHHNSEVALKTEPVKDEETKGDGRGKNGQGDDRPAQFGHEQQHHHSRQSGREEELLEGILVVKPHQAGFRE